MAPFKIAVEGCCHGSLNHIYTALESKCQSRGWTMEDIDILIICGDFQAVRNERDLNCMSVPRKYRQMGDFHLYYSGKKRAPVLTLVIGGNHEASNYFSELHYGGWLAPNIYYPGAVNVLRYGPLRIAGLSGIFHRGDYNKPHHECLPYDRDEIRSVYHVRRCDISKLLNVRSAVDIGLSHDWPRRVEYHGDCDKLFAERPHFLKSAITDNLGSEPAEQVLNHLRPRFWFSGHMHIKFRATVEHDDAKFDFFQNLLVPRELQRQLPKAVRTWKKPRNRPPGITNTTTHFLALDKPGPDSEFLELLEIESCWEVNDPSVARYLPKTPGAKFSLHYDEEWLSILRATDGTAETSWTFLGSHMGAADASLQDRADEARAYVHANVTAKGLLRIPDNFQAHAPEYGGSDTIHGEEQPCKYPNSQTEALCELLGITTNKVDESASSDEFVVFQA
ncbi:lariat debranching enzyme, C-terminal domain-containing protein [Diaporthe sp. PMI_573]|nr:lariat debranching enzyme, C-terminal domain-containing protein [Diaporthaceae sp. PMI_573]